MRDRNISWDEFYLHTKKGSMWVKLGDQVYDVTDYCNTSNDSELPKYAGLDLIDDLEPTDGFRKKVIENSFKVGQLQGVKPHDFNINMIRKKIREESPFPLRKFTIQQVRKHSKQEDLWVIHEREVYDVTDFYMDHPGGPDKLIYYGGKNIEKAFKDVGHSPSAQKKLQSLKIGVLAQEEKSMKRVIFAVSVIAMTGIALLYTLKLRKK